MSRYQMQATKTVSTCTPDTAQGTHVFDIFGYSQHKGIGIHEFIRSGAFSVGGVHWAIRFYPDGFGQAGEGMDYVSAYLVLLSKGVSKVRASCDVRLVDQTTGLSSSVHPTLKVEKVFNHDDTYRNLNCMMMKQSELEAPPYLVNDRLTMECVVTVKKEPRVSTTKPFPRIKVPQSDIKEQLGKLLEAKEGADVTFSVAGETFPAHKLVLAMRSPVFKAELCGSMRETGTQPITIKDMQPDVFRALLHFIYTDSLPAMCDFEGDDNSEMIRHLLVAADRFAVDRLKMICQCILCKNLHVRTVATTLALADQHHCNMLKDACIEFMSCSNIMNDVVVTQGYMDLERTGPSVLADARVKMSMFNKMRKS